MKNFHILVVLLVLNVIIFLTPMPLSYSQDSSGDVTTQESTTRSFISDWLKSIRIYVPAIVGSFIVGVIGSAGYFVALKLGFITADKIEEKFKTTGAPVAFVIIGGAVAIIFQLPQAETFTPIQSFVLGITWPFIVSQYVSRAGKEGADIIKQLRGG